MELDILLFLANNPQFTTASEIVEIRHLTKSHVSLAVNTLVEKGCLTKRKSAHNRKTIHLELCPAANNMIRDGQDAQKFFGSVLFRDFTADEYEQIASLFERMYQNIKNYQEES